MGKFFFYGRRVIIFQKPPTGYNTWLVLIFLLPGSSDMETSLLSEAFQQSQMHVETFLMTILSWTVDLFTVYKEKESLFTLLALLHFHVVDFLKLIGIKASWENTGKQEKTNVRNLDDCRSLKFHQNLVNNCVILNFNFIKI